MIDWAFPGGAQCDADGCLWIAISGASKCIRLGRDGRVDHVIELPVKCPTSLTFGGRDLDTIFVTTRGPDGGSLYAVGPGKYCEEHVIGCHLTQATRVKSVKRVG